MNIEKTGPTIKPEKAEQCDGLIACHHDDEDSNYEPIKNILFADWKDRVLQDGMFETSKDESTSITSSDPEKWYISLNNAQEFIEALNFQ